MSFFFMSDFWGGGCQIKIQNLKKTKILVFALMDNNQFRAVHFLVVERVSCQVSLVTL